MTILVEPPRTADPLDHPDAATPAYAWYALFVLILAYILAFLDRQILNLLVQPIKRDLHLSDVQISLLQGLSFALFLSLGGLPIGRLIDTTRRTRLLGICIVVWSVASAGCGLARGYAQLLLCRIGVGVGEAAMTPSAYSLIGDYFGARRQGVAMALYSVGAYLGSGLALLVGAEITARVPTGPVAVPLLGALQGWQLVFVLIGMPGLVIALWMITLREPRRTGTEPPALPLREVLAWFRGRAQPLILVNLAVAFVAIASNGMSAWLPTFFLRHFGMTTVESGRTLGLIVILVGGAATLSAGALGDWLRRRGHKDGRLRVMIAGILLATPFAVATPLADTAGHAFLLLIPSYFFLVLAVGSGPATLQEVTPRRMRGMQHAFAVLAVNLLGLGLGPTIVALITDHVLHDEAKVGLSIAIAAPVALLVALILALFARAPYTRALAAHDVA
jgi:MFS family permease